MSLEDALALRWSEDCLKLLDQRLLPEEERYLSLCRVEEVIDAIRNMAIRGAPAIGIAGAYGVVLSAKERFAPKGWREAMEKDMARLLEARPTAVNLRFAIERMKRRLEGIEGDPVPELLEEALAIHAEDIEANRRMGELGAKLIEGPCRVLTHCNTGALATGGFGTALGVIKTAYAQGKIGHVYATETRPFLQGARLTAWELAREAIPATLLVDGAAALLMAEKGVAWLIVGADRIARNGDVANKIGTYALALAARRHGVKCMVVAPMSSFDAALADGKGIPIEHRPPAEVLTCRGRSVAPSGVAAWNPAFDLTPAELIDAYVTERGIARDPSQIKVLLEKAAILWHNKPLSTSDS